MLPFPIKPMLLNIVKEPFESPDFLYEWKVDGIRCVMFYDHGQVRLHSKTGRECTGAFPELLAPKVNTEEAILDGEITVLTGGKPDFEAIMARYMSTPTTAKSLVETKPAYFIVWDIIWHNGNSLVNLPLLERKDILDRALENSDRITKIDWIDGKGLALWEAVKTHGLEGMVAKKKNSRYEFRRSSVWLKVKNYQEAVVNVLGYKQKDGYLLVGTDNKIQGHALGMGKTEKAALWEIIERYGTIEEDITWLPPGIRGKVKFTTWTPKGNMRDCSWVSFEV